MNVFYFDPLCNGRNKENKNGLVVLIIKRLRYCEIYEIELDISEP